MTLIVDPVKRPQVIRALRAEQVQPATIQFTDQGAMGWRVR